jgi:hypothetical protein
VSIENEFVKTDLIVNTRGPKKLTAEERQEAYESYCKHIAGGFCKESWCWEEHKKHRLTNKTMEKWIRISPEEFSPHKKEQAEAQSLKYWERILYSSADGTNPDASTASLQMVMRNKFGWDKPKEREDNPSQLEHFKSIMAMLSQKQGPFVSVTMQQPVGEPKTLDISRDEF